MFPPTRPTSFYPALLACLAAMAACTDSMPSDSGDDKADLGFCGDGGQALCAVIPPPCPAGLEREIVNGCFGECVDPVTCLAPGGGPDCALEIALDCPDGEVDGCTTGQTPFHQCIEQGLSCEAKINFQCPDGKMDGCFTGETTVHHCVPALPADCRARPTSRCAADGQCQVELAGCDDPLCEIGPDGTRICFPCDPVAVCRIVPCDELGGASQECELRADCEFSINASGAQVCTGSLPVVGAGELCAVFAGLPVAECAEGLSCRATPCPAGQFCIPERDSTCQ